MTEQDYDEVTTAQNDELQPGEIEDFGPETLVNGDSEIRHIVNSVDDTLVKRIQAFVCDFDPTKDKYSDTLVAQAYVSARKCYSGALTVIARNMGIPYNEFMFYMKGQPEFAAAVRMGILDAKEDAVEKLNGVIFQRAMGMTVTETKVEEGETERGTLYKETKTTKEIPPDINAAIALLQKHDVAWRQSKGPIIDASNTNYNLTLNVAPDRNIDIDYSALSPEALKEILNSDKILPTKDGRLNDEGQYIPKIKSENTQPQPKRGRKWTEEQKRKAAETRAKNKALKEKNKK